MFSPSRLEPIPPLYTIFRGGGGQKHVLWQSVFSWSVHLPIEEKNKIRQPVARKKRIFMSPNAGDQKLKIKTTDIAMSLVVASPCSFFHYQKALAALEFE